MKDFKGTPGPWNIIPTISHKSYYAFYIEETQTDAQHEADLKAIRATVDIVEALQALIEHGDKNDLCDEYSTFTSTPSRSPELSALIKNARQALSKAVD